MATDKRQQDHVESAKSGKGKSQNGAGKSGGANGAGTNSDSAGETADQQQTPAAEQDNGGGAEKDEKAPAVENRENKDSNGTGSKSGVLNKIREKTVGKQPETLTLDDWLERCKTDSGAYIDYDERLAIELGEPEVVDTQKSGDARERRVHEGEKIPRYKYFQDFFDFEHVAKQIADYLKGGAKGILVLRGPVGSGKTEAATVLEKINEQTPIYVLKCKKTGKLSPFNDHPKCLFSDSESAKEVSEECGIPQRYLSDQPSSWVTKRIDEAGGDFTEAFDVEVVHPDRNRGLGAAKFDPKDPDKANFDDLIGEEDMTMVGEEDPLNEDRILASGDPDAYKPGAFSQSHQGVFHGAEFFRNNPALMNTFLEGVTTGYFAGSKSVGNLPMKQFRVFTTNDPVWQGFISKNDSDAARNRIRVIDVPYTLRMSEEKKIYEKILGSEGHDQNPIAPKTLDLLSEFAVVTRLKDGPNGELANYDKFIRAQVHNGDIPDAAKSKVPKIRELKKKQSPDEGMDGFTIRDAETVLKETFNARSMEGIREADPILLFETLRRHIDKQDQNDVPDDVKEIWHGYIETLAERYKTELDEEINHAMTDADDGTCQAMFDKYILYAKHWINDEEYRNPDSGESTDLDKIDRYLSNMEKQAGIQSAEASRFRENAVNAYDREIANIAKRNHGKNPEDQEDPIVHWTAYEPLAKVIRAQNRVDMSNRRHIFEAKSEQDFKNEEERRQHRSFYQNMHEAGYTNTMVARALHHLNFT